MTSPISRQVTPVPMAVAWRDGNLWLLDQTRLPFDEHVFHCDTLAAVYDAIRDLKVRGAPAIGIAAAYGCWWGWILAAICPFCFVAEPTI
jgi:methylthioribose-1-phosphate isomerase